MLNHSHLLRPSSFPFHARYPESSRLCWEHGTVHARLISPRPSCQSIPVVRKWTVLRFWFSPFLPSPSRADRSPLVEEENYARRSRERKLAAALLWVRIRSSLAAALGVRGSVYAPLPNAHTLPPVIRSSRTSLCPPCSSLWVWGTTGPLVCLCLELRAVNFMNVSSAVYVQISDRNFLTAVLRLCLYCCIWDSVSLWIVTVYLVFFLNMYSFSIM